MDNTRERNRAVRIAYQHARKGDAVAVDAWLNEVAVAFAQPTPKQLAHAAGLLARGPRPIPGQLNIEGKEAA